MKNVLNLIETVVQAPLTPETLVSLRRAPRQLFRMLGQEHRAFEKEYALPTLPSGEIRPYVRTSTHGVSRSGITISSFTDFESPDPAVKATDMLIKHLLYCHSIAVDNPLAYLLDYSDLDTDEWRNRLFNCLHFLACIRPLVDAGIVHLVEWWPGRQDGYRNWPPQLFDETLLQKVATTTDWNDMQPLFATSVDKLKTEFKTAFLGLDVAPDIAIPLVMSREFGGNLDLYLPRRCQQDLFRQLVQRGSEEIHALLHNEHDKLLMAELLDLQVPRLTGLSVSDIVSIRQNEAVFEDWRSALRGGLHAAMQLPPDLFKRKESAMQMVQDALLPLAHRLEVKTARSRLMGSARKGTSGFVIKTLEGTISAPLDFGAALKAGLVKGALEFLWHHLTAHTPAAKAQHALHRHLLTFSP